MNTPILVNYLLLISFTTTWSVEVIEANVVNSTSSSMEVAELANIQNSSSTKIVGGLPARPGQFPFQVALLYLSYQFCSGSLISPRHIITAAHCTIGFNHNATGIKARVGSNQWNKGGIVIKVVEILQHEKYQGPRTHHEYDVCILVLAHNVPLSYHVDVVDLPRPNRNPKEGATALLAGWGSIVHGAAGVQDLRFVELPIVHLRRCSDIFLFIDEFDNPRSIVCAGGEEGKDGCQGDSGGGLVMKSNSRVKTLVGIVSNGRGCGHPGVPAIYTNVSKYIHWIHSQMFSSRITVNGHQNLTAIA